MQEIRHPNSQTIMNEMSVLEVSGYLRFATKASPLNGALIIAVLGDLKRRIIPVLCPGPLRCRSALGFGITG